MSRVLRVVPARYAGKVSFDGKMSGSEDPRPPSPRTLDV
jgi:hypothetical protein